MSDSATVVHSDGGVQDNGLRIEGPPWGLEKIFDYEPGGHHPVHLADMLHERYRVIHKLGSGGYANVWLCRDTSASSPKYVATKIMMGDDSTAACSESRVSKLMEVGCGWEANLSLPLDQFDIDGPNGTHRAFVYPVLGPRVSRLLHMASLDDPGPPLRKMCHEATEALASLHAHGICHGDFRPANILVRIYGLDGLTEEEVLKVLGTPETTKLTTVSGASHDLQTAPTYLVYPVNWDQIIVNASQHKLVIGSTCLIDFGESYELSTPPTEIGIPQVYCSPEQSLEHKFGKGGDIWALGCTLFEIRTGRKLFDTFDDDVDEHLCKVAMILGKYPEPWWSETWELRREFLKDEVDDSGRVIDVYQESNSGNMAATQTQSQGPQEIVFQQAEPRSLQDSICIGLIYENHRSPGALHKDIPSEEAEVFADLLAKILMYDPEERLSAADVLEHRWFRLGN